jgi:hypothetical protein
LAFLDGWCFSPVTAEQNFRQGEYQIVSKPNQKSLVPRLNIDHSDDNIVFIVIKNIARSVKIESTIKEAGDDDSCRMSSEHCAAIRSKITCSIGMRSTEIPAPSRSLSGEVFTIEPCAPDSCIFSRRLLLVCFSSATRNRLVLDHIQGQSVLLIVDSITRFAHAARDVAMAAGELAVARGCAPSVFSELPKLLERAGSGEEGQGAITGIFSVLVDGDDHNDLVADAIRGTLDGHIVLDRAIADQGRFPAVNVLTTISCLAQTAWTTEQSNLAAKLRAVIARYEDTRDLRLMGGYRQGSDAELEQAVVLVPKIYDAITQSPNSGPSKDAFRELIEFFQAK